MWATRKADYPWNDFKDGKMGCKVCSSEKHVSVNIIQGSRVSLEWLNYEVGTHTGTSKSAMLLSLRRKVTRHSRLYLCPKNKELRNPLTL